MILSTPINLLQKVLSSNSTDASFTALANTRTDPTGGTGVLTVPTSNCGRDIAAGGSRAPNNLLLIPYGTNSDGDLFNMRVSGWTRAVDSSGTLIEYVPMAMYQFACTIGTSAGAVSGLGATSLFCDSIALTWGFGESSLSSPVGLNLNGAVVVDVMGSELVQVQFDLDTGAAAMNALYRWL